MILILKDDHKHHLSVLITQSVQVVQDFCKLALDFLRKGPNPKLYQTAAQKLNVSPEVIRNAVDGLVHLLVESCRNKLDEQDFQDSVLALGFSEQQQQTLSTFYHSKKEEIQSALLRPTLDIPHYQDLDWRVDIQLASRALHHQVTPLVTMKLSLDNGQCIPLQTDPNNLLHMTQVLEQALQEAKGSIPGAYNAPLSSLCWGTLEVMKLNTAEVIQVTRPAVIGGTIQ